MCRLTLLFIAVLFATAITETHAVEKPLKVYILAGQSNMQGHAQVRTFEHLGMDAGTAPILKEMHNTDGTPKTCEQVWISSIGHDGSESERHGRLAADYGAAGRGPKIGPEYTFGIYTQKYVKQPILIIKTAWGGKSLNTDFRPPSAGPYEFNEQQLANFKKQGQDIQAIRTARVAATGRYYRLMMDHVKNVLGDIKRVCPDYDPETGFELAGFVWFQGWNDMVDRGTYPNRGEPGGYDQYSEVLAHFIRDVRKELSAPNLPFVIGVMGVGGPVEKYRSSQLRYKSTHSEFRQAMAAPAEMPEFQGNVVAVLTEKYWDTQLGELSARWDKVNAKSRSLKQDKSLSEEERKNALDVFTAELFTPQELKTLQVGKSNAEYHYLGSAKIVAQIGKAFADALAEQPTFSVPKLWQYSAPLISPEKRSENPSRAQKDPTVVRHGNNWHVFMTVKLPGKSAIEYCSFEDWKDADKAPRSILRISDSDYYCAPQVFFFRPHKKWYLVYQMGVPQSEKMWVAYSTTSTIENPDSWTRAKPMLDGGPSDPRQVGGLDFWIICDHDRAYLFYTSLNGKMWRLWTKLDQFPQGFGHCEVALEANVFEASHTYRLKGLNRFLTIIEENGQRYYKAYLADKLDGEWVPIADSWRHPFAGATNMAPAEGVEAWTDNVSHGELVRVGIDETLTVDPRHLRFVFQGILEKDKVSKGYGQFPWRIGMLTASDEGTPKD